MMMMMMIQAKAERCTSEKIISKSLCQPVAPRLAAERNNVLRCCSNLLL
jgi:hypothetical protein